MRNEGVQETIEPGAAPRPLTWSGVIHFTAEIHSWQVQVIDRADGADCRITASASLRPHRDYDRPSIVVGSKDRSPLGDTYAEIIFKLRSDADGEEPQEQATSGNDPLGLWPKKPIGQLTGWDEVPSPLDRHPTTVLSEIGLSREHLWELRDRQLAGLPLPIEIVLTVPEARMEVIRPSADGEKPHLLLAEQPLIVTRALWTYEQVGERSWDDDLTGPLKAVFDNIDWQSDGWKIQHEQFRQIVSELVGSALVGARSGSRSYRDARAAGRSAWRLACDLYQALADAEYSTRFDRRISKTKSKGDEKYTLSYPWTKRSPAQDFNLGKDSISWSSITRTELSDLAQRYLSEGLDSPTFEWVVVDALTYSEVRDFGEHLKLTSPLLSPWFGPRSGNLQQIGWARLREQAIWLIIKGALWLGLPAYLAWSKWREGDGETAILVGVVWLAITLIWPLLKKAMGVEPTSAQERLKKQSDLLGSMIMAYADISLDRPARVALRSLERAAEQGAAWDGDAWSLLIAADRRDPARWRSWNRAADGLGWSLRHALRRELDRRKDAGEAIPQPTFDGKCASVEGAKDRAS